MALLTIAALVEQNPAAILRAGVGAVGLFGFYFVLAFAYPAGMGFGDVKLAGLVGGILGFLSYSTLLVGAFAAFFIGSAVGLLVILSRRGTGKTAIPFGPFMVVCRSARVVRRRPHHGLLLATGSSDLSVRSVRSDWESS